MTPEQSALVTRVRALLPADAAVREVSMFGGRALMVDERMLVSAGKDGSLLVRVDETQHEQLMEHPGTSQPTMGEGRSMGPRWILVAQEALTADGDLASWIETALAHHRTAG